MADCIARAYSRQVTHLGGISRKGCKSHSARCVITREVTFRKAYGTFSQAQLPSGDICFEKVEKNLVEMMMFWLKKCRLLVGGFCTRSLVQKKMANPCFGFVSFCCCVVVVTFCSEGGTKIGWGLPFVFGGTSLKRACSAFFISEKRIKEEVFTCQFE